MFADFVLPGIIVGLGAAISPGPILLLLISETLRGGIRSGWSVAVAPLITDIPFVAISIFLAKEVNTFQPLIGILSLLGAAFLLFLAYQNITIHQEDLYRPASAPASFAKGVITNLLNPYLYIFWFSVALPVFARGNILGSTLFASSLLSTSVGSMMIVAVIVALLRMRFLGYLHWVLRVMGVLLFMVALMFVREGLKLL